MMKNYKVNKDLNFAERVRERIKHNLGDEKYNYITDILQKFVWKTCNFHKKGNEKDIMIFTSGRSGGTWLTEMICTTKGIKYVQEPLSLELINEHRIRVLYELRSGYNFIDETKNLEPLKNYFIDLIEGKINIKNPWLIYKPYFHPFTNRIVFKICKALPLIRWFYDNFNAEFVYFIRHPIASSISMKEYNFRIEIDGYLQNDFYTKKHLNPDLKEYSDYINNNGTILQKYLLRWVLENIVPYREISNCSVSDILILSYEELISYPEDTLKYLSEKLNLDEKRMINYLHIPSATTIKKFSKDKYGPDSPFIRNWINKVTKKEIRECFEIIKKFGISMYNENSLLPEHKFLMKSKMD